MLRVTDLHPVEGRFEFRNQEWVEYSEISDASTTDGGTPADTSLEAPMRRVVPSRPAALPSGNPASISEELRVLAALHEIGADLGDPVEVTRSGGRVLVSGVGVPPQRQHEIHRALDRIPNVTCGFPNRRLRRGRRRCRRRAGRRRRRPASRRGSSSNSAAAPNSTASAAAARRDGHGDVARLCVAALAQRFPEGTEMSARIARCWRIWRASTPKSGLADQRSSSYVGSRAGLPGRLPRPGQARKQPRRVAAGRRGRISPTRGGSKCCSPQLLGVTPESRTRRCRRNCSRHSRISGRRSRIASGCCRPLSVSVGGRWR